MQKKFELTKKTYVPGVMQNVAHASSPTIRISTTVALVILLVTCLLANLPFISQAFHIDDTLFIYQARHIILHPLDPYNFTIVYNGVLQTAYSIYPNPPLDSYIIAMMMRLAGEREVPLHLMHIFYPLMCSILIYFIAGKFLHDNTIALEVALICIFSPAIYVMGHMIMLDLPVLFFCLAALFLFLEAGDRKSLLLYAASGLFGGAACLTRYTALAIFPILFLFVFARPQNKAWRAVITLGLSGALFLFWYFAALKLYSSGYWHTLFSLESKHNDLPYLGMHVLANLTYCAGTSVFPLSFFVLFPAIGKRWIALLYALYCFILLWCGHLLINMFGHTLPQAMLFFVLCAAFGLFICAAFSRMKQMLSERKDLVALLAWIVLMISYNSLFLHTSVKYNVLTIPPIAILFAALVKEIWPKRYLRILTTTTLLTILLGLTVGLADTIYANSYKAYSQQLYARYKTSKNKIYFTGHWGWEYYMSQLGALPILSRGPNDLRRGDVIIVPSVPWPQTVPEDLRRRVVLREKIDVASMFPVRTMNGPARAFFYANYNYPNYLGVLPYAVTSSIPLDRFYVLEVQ